MNNYTLIKRIGAGSFGTVHLAENNENGKKVVVKVERSKILVHINFFHSFTNLFLTLKKRIPVSGLDEARRRKVFEEFRLLSCLEDISIVR